MCLLLQSTSTFKYMRIICNSNSTDLSLYLFNFCKNYSLRLNSLSSLSLIPISQLKVGQTVMSTIRVTNEDRRMHSPDGARLIGTVGIILTRAFIFSMGPDSNDS